MRTYWLLLSIDGPQDLLFARFLSGGASLEGVGGGELACTMMVWSFVAHL
jgi:hypothetical protein